MSTTESNEPPRAGGCCGGGYPMASVPPRLESAPAAGPPPLLLEPVDAAGIDRLVLQYAVLNGALDLLPGGIGIIAILPLQMRMIYRIGKHYGYRLDRGHIRDFLAGAGVGLAAGAAAQVGRRLAGQLAGNFSGGWGGLAAGAGTGAAFSFAATYAIGQLADRYYACGRRMKMAVLRDAYGRLLTDGRKLFGLHAAAVRSRADRLRPAEVIDLVCRPQ